MTVEPAYGRLEDRFRTTGELSYGRERVKGLGRNISYLTFLLTFMVRPIGKKSSVIWEKEKEKKKKKKKKVSKLISLA